MDSRIGPSNSIPEKKIPQSHATELESLRDEIFLIWSKSEARSQIEELLIKPNSEILEFVQESNSTKLRGLVFGPSVQSRHALEPIEDLGYPTFPSTEIGCTVGIQPKFTDSGLPSLWLGALLTANEGEILIAVAIVARASDLKRPCDIVKSTEIVQKFGIHDANQFLKIQVTAGDAIKRFIEVLAESFDRK